MLKLPVQILKFWYFEAPQTLLNFFVSLNKTFIGVFSLTLMIKTFFRPWKNEYREGLVGFSIFMGACIKSLFILADLVLFVGLILAEVLIFISLLVWPVAAFVLPFIRL